MSFGEGLLQVIGFFRNESADLKSSTLQPCVQLVAEADTIISNFQETLDLSVAMVTSTTPDEALGYAEKILTLFPGFLTPESTYRYIDSKFLDTCHVITTWPSTAESQISRELEVLSQIPEYLFILNDEFTSLSKRLTELQIPMTGYVGPWTQLIQGYSSKELTKVTIAEFSLVNPHRDKLLSNLKQKNDQILDVINAISHFASELAWLMDRTFQRLWGPSEDLPPLLNPTDILQLKYTQAIDDYMHLGGREYALPG